MRPLILAPAMLACTGASALAAEPTLEQLLATPSPVEIATKWKAVCLDHAGDAGAQRRAVRELNIDWPYQAMFDKDAGKPACLMVSSIEPQATAQSLGDAITKASAPLVLENVELRGNIFRATAVINGSIFRVQTGLRPSQGVTTAVVVLIDMKAKFQ